MGLIEKQAAIDAIYKCTDIYINNLPVMMDKAEIYKAISELPYAQPEIIRCKDCKHRPIEKYGEIMPPKEDGWDDRKCPCLCEDYFYSWRPKGDWFCAGAERRTDGNT